MGKFLNYLYSTDEELRLRNVKTSPQSHIAKYRIPAQGCQFPKAILLTIKLNCLHLFDRSDCVTGNHAWEHPQFPRPEGSQRNILSLEYQDRQMMAKSLWPS